MSNTCPADSIESRFLSPEALPHIILPHGPNFSQQFAYLVNLLNHMFISFITIYMSWLCLKLKLKKTALHAWLCTLGFAFLLTEGVMAHYQGNVLTFSLNHENKTTIHWILQATGGILGIAGTIQKIVGKETHFKSWHGKFGLAACIFCGANMCGGLGALYSNSIRNIFSPSLIKLIHNIFGFITFILGMIAMYFGYDTGFFRRNSTEDFGRFLKFLIVVVLCLTGLAVIKGLVSRIANYS